MKQEDKELLLKDLCARLPYGVMCHANEINLDGELLFINKVYNIVALYNDKASGEFDSCPIADIKPYLRPMSSMTDDEQKELEKIIDGIIGYNAKNYFHSEDEYNWNTLYNAHDWLNAHHFDYRGLIPMRLALEAKEGMYES